MTDATWKKHPINVNYADPTNWSGGVVPDGTAFFGSSTAHAVNSSAAITVGGWQFAKGSPSYFFGLFQPLRFDGDGIRIKDSSVTISSTGLVEFFGGSTAGKVHLITNGGALNFNTSSTAGTSHILNFGSFVKFFDNTSAEQAHIDNRGILEFHNNSQAGGATIINGQADVMSFWETSNAGDAHITNDFQLVFNDSSSAAEAVITTLNGATTTFNDNSNGDAARLITEDGGTVNFAGSGPSSVHIVFVGSIEGGGDYFLGDNILLLTSNRSATVSGAISEGSLAKTGTGTLRLTHPNNTLDGVTLSAGTLDIAASKAAGSEIDFVAGNQILKVENAALVKGFEASFFTTSILDFGIGDAIDLPGLKFNKHTSAAYGSGVLDVSDGKVIDSFVLLGPEATNFKVSSDNHGGTLVTLPGPHARALTPMVETEQHFRFVDGLGQHPETKPLSHAGVEASAFYESAVNHSPFASAEVTDLSIELHYAAQHNGDFIL